MIEETDFQEGDTWTGMVYPPFQNVPPSSYTAEKVFGTPVAAAGPKRAPIVSSSEEGWVERPDTGRTLLSASPIGEPWILIVFAIIYGIMIHRKSKKSFALALLCMLNAGLACATEPAITGLTFSTESVVAEDSITVTPTISDAEGSLYVCYDRICRQTNQTFHKGNGYGYCDCNVRYYECAVYDDSSVWNA